MRDLMVLSGSSHPNLTNSICRNLTIKPSSVRSRKFSNGETSIEIKDSVREKDVFIVQSGCGEVNDNFIELLIMISACKTASAKRVTAVLPVFPYSRQPDVPHAASLTGAPSISTKKDTYTYESVPGTPKPLPSSEDSTRPVSPAPFNLNSNTLLERAASNSLKSPVSQKTPADSKSTLPLKPTSIITNSSSPNIVPVDAQGKTDSGYKQWVSLNGTLIASLLTTAGADRCITMDLHDSQFQGFFNIPVDNLYSKPLLKHYITDYIPNYQECVIVSPDSGGAKRATAIADALGLTFALIHKERRTKSSSMPPSTAATSTSSTPIRDNDRSQVVATTMLVGEVKDKVCVLVDDLVDTSYTVTRAAKLLKDQGAKYIYALVTHGIFSGDAVNRIKQSDIDKVITTNSVPQVEHAKELGTKIEVLDVSRVFAEAIRRINNGESVSRLFDHGW